MSAFPDLPDHFMQWLRTRCDYDTVPEIELRERFIPRMIYGDYLRSIMQHYLQTPTGQVTVRTTFIEGDVVDVVRLRTRERPMKTTFAEISQARLS